MKFKVGQKVKVKNKPMEYFEKLDDSIENSPTFIDEMYLYAGRTVIIRGVGKGGIESNWYEIEEDGQDFWWHEEYFESTINVSLKEELFEI